MNATCASCHREDLARLVCWTSELLLEHQCPQGLHHLECLVSRLLSNTSAPLSHWYKELQIYRRAPLQAFAAPDFMDRVCPACCYQASCPFDFLKHITQCKEVFYLTATCSRCSTKIRHGYDLKASCEKHMRDECFYIKQHEH